MATHRRENHRAAGRAAAICLAATILTAGPMSGVVAAQQAAANPASASGDGALPPKAHELLTLLAEEWLAKQGEAKSAAPLAQQTDNSLANYVNSGFGAIHDQIVALARAIPDLPNEFELAAARITAIDADFDQATTLLELGIFGDRYYVATRRLAAEARVLLNLAILGAFSFGAQWLFRKMIGTARRRLDGLPIETVKDRLRLIAARFALAFGEIAAFVLGSLGPFLALDWDPVRRELVLGFLIVFVVIRAAVATGDLLFAPNDERFRIIPTDTVAARFWCRRLTALAGSFALVWVIIQECDTLGFSSEGVRTRRLHARPGCPRHRARSGLAQTHHAPRGRGSTLSRNAPFRAGRGQHRAVDRHRAVVGPLGFGTRCNASGSELLARSRTHHSAGCHPREPARGRASA